MEKMPDMKGTYEKMVCTKCNGERKITIIKNGKKVLINCPTCKGLGRVS